MAAATAARAGRLARLGLELTGLAVEGLGIKACELPRRSWRSFAREGLWPTKASCKPKRGAQEGWNTGSVAVRMDLPGIQTTSCCMLQRSIFGLVQVADIRNGAHIVAATPGRLLDVIDGGYSAAPAEEVDMS